MLIPDFRILASFILLAYNRVKFIIAATAGWLDIIFYVLFESGDEEYMEI